MRRVIFGFALLATLAVPAALLLTRPNWPIVTFGILIMAVAHALVLWPTLRANSQWLGPVMTCFETTSNEVWLTIDDGPSDDTPAMLDALDARDVKATFFVKGTLVARRPDLVTMMLKRGHHVENHSHTHPAAAFWCLPPKSLEREIDACSAALKAAAGVQSRLFRAPVGMKNPFVHPILARRSMTLVGWSIRGFDSFGDDVQRVVRRIVPRVGAGSIVVMHQGRGFSVDCVSSVVDELQVKGYAFVVPAAERLKTKR
ncbi:MAG: peptidoglycan-N-acetylglucosamine deacetylase [Thermoanaerobaculia bacterium]|jgi:peptidoglycan/xylan/chitin deacetylase (PgdA/CDA1 family)|nr:peptidoglycan-N-acetylglucosamine deacetylase [Thermoanaerobaculia bacterium]